MEFQTVKSVLTPQECQRVMASAFNGTSHRSHFEWGTESQRDTDLYWLYSNNADHKWLFDRITESAKTVNDKWHHYQLEDSIKSCQLGHYATGQGYDWHMDLGDVAPRRKLSLSVQLNPTPQYKGGNLEFFREQPYKLPLEQGDMAIFPSWVLHRVTRILQGERYSLVAWFEGQPFC